MVNEQVVFIWIANHTHNIEKETRARDSIAAIRLACPNKGIGSEARP